MDQPTYFALVGAEHVESDDNFDTLLGILADMADPTIPDDIVIWSRDDGIRVVAVLLHTGPVLRFTQERQP